MKHFLTGIGGEIVIMVVSLHRFMKKETREFFGLDENNETSQKQRWEEKRRRLASRKYGNLKENSTSLSASLSASAAAGFGNGVGGRCVASGATVAVGGHHGAYGRLVIMERSSAISAM